MLRLRNASAAPWGPPLLRDINLELAAGDRVAVLGPNGAGKSTLLQLLAGGIPAQAGDVALAGRSLAAWPRREKARAVAILAQRSTLSFPFSVREVVALGRVPHASGSLVDEQIVAQAMQAMDVERLAGRRYTELSGGEQQRVQLARVLAQLWRPEDSPQRVLLLDEPAAALDVAHAEGLISTLSTLTDNGCALVFVAHDFNFASALAKRAIFLRDGEVFAQGPVQEVFAADVFEAVFAVSPLITAHPHSGRPLVFSDPAGTRRA
jgi:iron complex transport system ATP-binding protein